MRLLIFTIFYIFCQFAFAALPATMVWEIDSAATASNVNAGGFDSAKIGVGTDYSKQPGSQYSGSNLASANGTTNPCAVTSATHNFVTADEGNVIFISAGTNWTAGRYVINSTAGNAATLDRACGSAAGLASGTFVVGGAFVVGDDAVFELGIAGNKFWIKNGSYATGAINLTAAGSATSPIFVEGYASTRGDKPTGSTRPAYDSGSNGWTMAANWDVSHMRIRGTGSGVYTTGSNGKLMYSKITNYSNQVNRAAIVCSADGFAFGNELISYRGRGSTVASTCTYVGNYFHSSDKGILGATNSLVANNNIFESMVTAAIETAAASTTQILIQNNTMFGAINKLGIGVNIATGSTDVRLSGNIISGFATGVSHADVQTVGLDAYNNYYNNTANGSNWALGSTSITTDPGFRNVTQLTGATATTSGSDITQSGANFTTSGVVAGRDYIYIVSGTGITAGYYGITVVGTTTLTLDIAPGTSATADKVWQITMGHDYAVGLAPRNKGFPAVFPAALTTSYPSIGAVQAMPGMPRRGGR